MAHIVFSVRGITARLNASFELAYRLRSQGHRITFVTYFDLQDRVKDNGFECIGVHWGQWITFDSEDQLFRGMRLWQKVFKFKYLWRVRRKIINRFVTNTELEDVLRELKPDLLLIDLEMQPYVIATKHLGIPTILFFTMFTVWKTPGIPPPDSSLVPNKSWFHQIEVKWLWFRWSVQRFRMATRSKLSSFGTDWISTLKVLARYKQFPFREEADLNHWMIPFAFRNLPIIIANAIEMEFSQQHPKNVHYIGPLLWQQRREKGANERFEKILEKLTRQRRDEKVYRPLIYCSTSSYVQGDIDLLRRVSQVFEIRKDWDLILGLGGRIDIHDLGHIPPNVFAFEWAPQVRVLEHADCAINHGGSASIREAIYFGVPMVVYSIQINEGNGNAARVAYHRLGIAADKNADSIQDIMQNIELVLTDSIIKRNISDMREVYLNYEKSNCAVLFVEKFIEESCVNTQR